MPRSKRELSSAFAADLDGYVSFKRELNFKATKDSALAAAFDRFCEEERPGSRTLDLDLALDWIARAGGPVAAAHRASFARGFASYLVLSGKDACILPGKATPIKRPRPAPRILAQAEAAALLSAADSLEENREAGLRHLIAPVIFRLMLCSGLRPHEARTLPVARFDLARGIISVEDSKGRDRDVPVKRDVADMCADYSERVEAVLPGRAAFFPNGDGSGCWSQGCLNKAFRICRDRVGPGALADPQPVPYSLRHTFATECVRRWMAQGVDIPGNIRVLQAYMGHEQVESTLYYVHLVRGGAGDPGPYGTWEPANRMEGLYG